MHNNFFKCNKCGSLTATKDDQDAGMCTLPVTYRTSGICGGGFSIKITEEEYKTTIEKWMKERNK